MKNNMPTHKINFRGYWRDINKGGIPKESGIYLVYRSIYHPDTDKVTLKEIIYIGQSGNVGSRIATHEKMQEFLDRLQNGEELCFSFGYVKLEELDIIENALIFAQKPMLNTELKDKYLYEDAAFLVEGKCALMKYTDFNITSTPKSDE